MRPSISLFNVLVLLLAGSAASASDGVGVRQLSVVAPERDTPLSVTVWYPAEAGGEPVAVGESKIFEGTRALKGATIRKQRFPLILLSHGSGSRVEGMAWIATKLAETGFVVAGPNHPGTTSGDSTPAATPKIWERTGDLSAITTALTADPVFGIIDRPASYRRAWFLAWRQHGNGARRRPRRPRRLRALL